MMKYEVGVVHKQVACVILSCKRPLGWFEKRFELCLDWGHSVFL